MNTLWHEYRADLHVDRLVGGIPSNPLLIQAWLDAKRPAARWTCRTGWRRT